MTAQSFVFWPLGTALAKQVIAVMDVILHIGAHRTATTTFQHYLRQNEAALLQRGVAVWGPRETRKGLFHGILPNNGSKWDPKRAKGRIALRLEALERRGVSTVLVSDENMLGTIYANLKSGELYKSAGQRVAHFVQAFDAGLSKVVMSVRGQDKAWASAIAYSVARGRALPSDARLASIAHANRSWRDVVTDVACAADRAALCVTAFDSFAGQPEAHFKAMTGIDGPKGFARDHLHASALQPEIRSILTERGMPSEAAPQGQGRWNPFSQIQTAALLKAWHKDHDWLRTGADGIADYIDNTSRTQAGPNLPSADLTRGHGTDDRQESGMAHAR